jgi:F-type H+-transporting ATPase subunit a
VANPMEQFQIHRMSDMAVGGWDAAFTNSALFMLIALAAITVFMVGGMAGAQRVPGRWQAAVESVYEFIRNMAHDNIGPEGRKFVPFLFSLFMFVLACNLLGMIPGAFTVTSHIAVTFALAMVVFLMVIVVGLARHGLHFFSLFLPHGVPAVLIPLVLVIEVISFLSRPVTLGVRLFANMTAGHVLLKVFAGFVISMGAAGGLLAAGSVLPLVMTVALIALEFLIAVIQAYVFAMLASIYLNDAVNLH